MINYKCGIESEYIFIDGLGSIRDFTNLKYDDIKPIMLDRPGEDDPELNKGDIGIKSGYWYLEGDERFDNTGGFVGMEVKGIEIRTPILDSIDDAVASIATLETELKSRLHRLGLSIASVGFNPVTTSYSFDPPLNQWEESMRKQHSEYDYAGVSNLTYGPDINLSFPDFSEQKAIDIAKKLTYYSPFIVPFSFSSPFCDSSIWVGPSKRTFERTWRRPAAKVFISNKQNNNSPITYQSRSDYETGRIEFKAFDAFISKDIMSACSYLVLGLCLDEKLEGRSESPDKNLHQVSATKCWSDQPTKDMARETLKHAYAALSRRGIEHSPKYLDLLESMLDNNSTPSDIMISEFEHTGRMYVAT